PRARGARERAAAAACDARQPGPGRRASPRRVPGAPRERARDRAAALRTPDDGGGVGAGRQHEGVGLLKALALVTRLPVPPWRGDQVRAYHHLRLLARRHDVTVCALVLGRADPAHAAAVEALGVRLELIPLGLAGAPVALARGFFDEQPLQVWLY